MNKFLTVVELSTTKVAVAVGENTDFGVKVIAHCTVPVRKVIRHGDVENTKKVVEALRTAVSMAQEEVGFVIHDVVLCLWGYYIRTCQIKVSRDRKRPEEFISDQELKVLSDEALKYKVGADEKVLKAIPQGYDIDARIGVAPNEAEGMRGTRIDAYYLLVIGKEQSVRDKYAVIRDANLNVIHTVISPLGSAAAALNENESENGVALLDIGGGTADLVIVRDGTVRECACIPFAGQTITDDIKSVACITAEMAELVKIKYGTCVADGVNDTKKLVIQGTGGSASTDVPLLLLAQVIEARLSEIFEAARYIIEESGYAEKIPAGIVLTGGTCYMENIRELAKAIFERNVRLANAGGHITESSEESIFDTYATSIAGAMMVAFDEIENTRIPQRVPLPDDKPATDIFGGEIKPEPEQPKQPQQQGGRGGLFRKNPKQQSTDKPKEKSSISDVLGGLFDGQFNNNA
ncbi:MAG: cell division protein FtsA [Bacteroidales bacterium]|jgi:cell division protein FtsA|nr:cell division protein FtsA [Bacteroidales bacterium]